MDRGIAFGARTDNKQPIHQRHRTRLHISKFLLSLCAVSLALFALHLASKMSTKANKSFRVSVRRGSRDRSSWFRGKRNNLKLIMCESVFIKLRCSVGVFPMTFPRIIHGCAAIAAGTLAHVLTQRQSEQPNDSTNEQIENQWSNDNQIEIEFNFNNTSRCRGHSANRLLFAPDFIESNALRCRSHAWK